MIRLFFLRFWAETLLQTKCLLAMIVGTDDLSTISTVVATFFNCIYIIALLILVIGGVLVLLSETIGWSLEFNR